MQSHIQFVPVSGPTRPMPSESRKLCHSHATRQAHAKKRRLRVHQHQKEVTLAQKEDQQTFTIALIPLNSAPNYHKGGLFTSLASSLAPAEYGLLRYYFSVLVPDMAVNCGLFNFEGDHGLRILRDWVGLAVADKNFLDTASLLYELWRHKDGHTTLSGRGLHG
ncbi:uncharacterized protein VDAG_03715 [Verticillium dahliae VdLs.17]|uniref:Uncharacterized protein n=1 Tax=Verticillium dahliae (strain VdLs.17 / ATCC MYA-4575 / FGSC 10137) TaxID=498257 RepID=G2X0D6_VERDV|nr:uncharacterized protein VDAG_03715 [Verticillium dahliae VdLs.17]EGY22277.1 hypothetical protein VDAG_03715 [Verticillium dahliae VdLs.17]